MSGKSEKRTRKCSPRDASDLEGSTPNHQKPAISPTGLHLMCSSVQRKPQATPTEKSLAGVQS